MALFFIATTVFTTILWWLQSSNYPNRFKAALSWGVLAGSIVTIIMELI